MESPSNSHSGRGNELDNTSIASSTTTLSSSYNNHYYDQQSRYVYPGTIFTSNSSTATSPSLATTTSSNTSNTRLLLRDNDDFREDHDDPDDDDDHDEDDVDVVEYDFRGLSDHEELLEDATELALWDGIFWLEACRSMSRSVTWFRLSSVVEGVREEAYRAGMWFATNTNSIDDWPPPPPPPPPLPFD